MGQTCAFERQALMYLEDERPLPVCPSCFWLLVIFSQAAMTICIQVFCEHAFISLEEAPSKDLLGQRVAQIAVVSRLVRGFQLCLLSWSMGRHMVYFQPTEYSKVVGGHCIRVYFSRLEGSFTVLEEGSHQNIYHLEELKRF